MVGFEGKLRLPVRLRFALSPCADLEKLPGLGCVLCAVLQREDKSRAKARKAAGKGAKPLWEEDGKRRGLLDKYDEEEEEQMMQASGVVWGVRVWGAV